MGDRWVRRGFAALVLVSLGYGIGACAGSTPASSAPDLLGEVHVGIAVRSQRWRSDQYQLSQPANAALRSVATSVEWSKYPVGATFSYIQPVEDGNLTAGSNVCGGVFDADTLAELPGTDSCATLTPGVPTVLTASFPTPSGSGRYVFFMRSTLSPNDGQLWVPQAMPSVPSGLGGNDPEATGLVDLVARW
jgi:hypothetical protein